MFGKTLRSGVGLVTDVDSSESVAAAHRTTILTDWSCHLFGGGEDGTRNSTSVERQVQDDLVSAKCGFGCREHGYRGLFGG
jgi:hypothetical protein